MAILAYAKFSGVAPRLTPWRLPPELAQTALNVNLESRTIKPWRDTSEIESGLTAHATSSIYRFGLDLVSDTQYWFHFAGSDVDFVKGPLVGDSTERTFYTGDGAPKWTNNTLALTGGPPYPADYRNLGVIAPTDAPAVGVTGTGSGDVESRVYVYTNVTTYGEESAPSPAATAVDFQEGQTVTISGFTAAPTGADSTTARRIYRSVTTSTNTNFYYIKEISSATSSTEDDATDVGEPLATEGWAVPPSSMFGLTAMANGIMVGFDGHDVCVSEAYAPYAWPTAFKLSTDYPIVGGKAIGNQVVVLTTGNPYLLTGSEPSTLSLTKLDWPQACVSKRSIVNVGGAVLYASPDGLCAIDGQGMLNNLTEGLMTREDWQALNPESILGCLYNNQYFGFYNTGVVSGGFILEPRENDAALSFIETHASAAFADLLQDVLFLKIGTEIHKWDASGTYSDYTWRSGVTTLPRPENFGAAQVWAEGYPVTFKLYGDGALKHAETVASSAVFRLPSGYKAAQYEVELTGDQEIYKVLVASTAGELRGA